MYNTASALNEFWNSFGLPAYTTDTVPDGVTLPYITYSLVESESLASATGYAQVWYRDTSNAEITQIVDEIKEAIGDGVLLSCTGGYVVLRPSTPYVQLQADKDPADRYAYINLQINCYHK